jgi:DNA-directed RNA polymerase specialized sigma subunit
MKGSLASAVDSLPPQERTVISLYYFEGLTLKEIKSVLDVSESRVSQIHAQAVIRLRSKLKAMHVEGTFREGDPNVKQKYVRKKPQTAS